MQENQTGSIRITIVFRLAPVTSEQFRKNIAAEVERWKRVVKESGIRQE